MPSRIYQKLIIYTYAMSKQFSVSEDVKQLINDIISQQNLNPVVEVKYAPGSEIGDGYGSQTISVSVISSRKTLHLFVKCALKIQSSEMFMFDTAYANETYFYGVILPAYKKFLKDRGDHVGFQNVPRCYGTSKEHVIALENLRTHGFELFERNRTMDDEHIKMVLQTFARFHAISFAFKDQNRETYDELVKGAFDSLSGKLGETVFTKVFRAGINDFLKKLDPIDDKEILDKCDGEDLLDDILSADRNLNEYSILTKGDCWCNNMMFRYESSSKEKPTDVMLIDWQVIRPASPVFDISSFYFSVASGEILSKTEDYLKFYHDELSQRIRQLGSDPEILYPSRVFLEEWKRHCRFGFSLGIVVIKVMLSTKDETLNLEEMNFDDEKQMENLYPKFEKEEEYLRRIKVLAKYVIGKGYL